MERPLTRILAFAVILLTPFIGAPHVSAQSDNAIEAAHRVNIAGRQRMLSQRLAKAACLIHDGVDVNAQRIILRDVFDLFAVSHAALRFGDDTMGVGAPESQTLINFMRVIDRQWNTLSSLIEPAVKSGNISTQALGRIDNISVHMMADIDKMVSRPTGESGLSNIALLLSMTINLAGRQRMFTQKAAKELCLIDAGIDQAANRENLGKTVQFFSLTLDALIGGIPGMVMAAPNSEIRQKLLDIKALWGESQAALQVAIAGGTPANADVQAVSRNMDRVMVLMNEAVALYEEVIPE